MRAETLLMMTINSVLRSIATLLAISAASAVLAQSPKAANPEISVGIKNAPPFVMKDSDGEWRGIAVDLWKRAASEIDQPYRLVEVETVNDLLDYVVHGKFDIAVGAVTITPGRERLLDFSQPYYVTGLGIAVPAETGASWWPVLRSITSFGFLQAVAALMGLSIAVGVLLWLVERRHNEHFSGTIVKGLSSSVWWSAAAMTQRWTGDYRPLTLPGRIIAVLWLVVSIIAIAVFTAGLTSTLTMRKLHGSVQNVGDLSTVRVGTVTGTATEETLARMRLSYRSYADINEGLRALREGKLDAFVHDKPLLAWTIRQNYSLSLELLDITFDPQTYGFALPPNSQLRKPLNLALLNSVQSDWWRSLLFRYTGER
jgi:ABC-type amino acid transport substrate-binding protein